MGSWDIIIFEKEQSCAYIPSSWAVNTSKTVYLWRKVKSATQLKRLQDDCKPPDVDITYEEYQAVCKTTVYNLKQAHELSEKLVYTSNVTSEEECGGYADPENNLIAGNHNACSMDNTSEKKFCRCVDLTNKFEKVSKGLAALKFDVTDLKKEIIDMRLTLGQVLEKNPTSNKRRFHLPIKEESALVEIEDSVKDDETFAELVSTLSLLAADDLKKSVYSIMKRLLGREISLKFSAMGKKGKRNFSELKVYQAVLDAVRISYPNSMEKDIVRHLSSCLATAGDREGGRKVRQSQPKKVLDNFEENI